MSLRAALAAEYPGDTWFQSAYEQHSRAEAALEEEINFQILIAPEQERFNLYRTYNHLVAAWLQVKLLLTQLNSIAAAGTSFAEEENARSTLHDQAQFALWELGQAESDLQRDMPDLKRPDYLRINEAIRSFLSHVRISISQLSFENCARIVCAPSS